MVGVHIELTPQIINLQTEFIYLNYVEIYLIAGDRISQQIIKFQTKLTYLY